MTDPRPFPRFHPLRQPSERLREECRAYRVASDAFILACHEGCSGSIADGLYALMEREREHHEQAEAAA